MRLNLLTEYNTERVARRATALVTDIATGEQWLLRYADVAADPLISAFMTAGKSGTITVAGRTLFLTVAMPPPRLLITGAVHISQVLAPMAQLMGYDITIIDPRTAFGTPERFPDVNLITEWPDVALPQLSIDRRTAVIALTHDPKIDDPCLHAALRSESYYIGALGSQRTHARRVDRLKAAGFDETEISRIHAPIGLDIGAVSTAEIALAILAEVTAALHKLVPAGEGAKP